MKYYITKAQSGISLIKPGMAKVPNNITISNDGKSFIYDKGWNRRFWYTPDGKLAYVKIDPLNNNVDFGKVTEIDPTDMNAIDKLFGKEYYHDGQANKNRQAVLDWLNPQIAARNARNNYSALEIVNGRPNAEVGPTQNRVPHNGTRVMSFDERPAVRTTTQESSRQTDPALTLRQKQDAYNRGRIEGGTDEAIKRLELLRSKNYNIAADGYWGAKSEEAWRLYQAAELAAAELARLLGLSNGELMKLNAEQIKAGDLQTQDRYNRLMAALAANDAARAKALTFNGTLYADEAAYNKAVADANYQAQAAMDRKFWTDMGEYANNIQSSATLMAVQARPNWMKHDSKRGLRYLDIAQGAIEADSLEAYANSLRGRDRRIYKRMMRKADPTLMDINKPDAANYVAEKLSNYVAPTDLKTIDMNAIEFNKKGGCMYKKGKRIPSHKTGEAIAYSKPEVLFLKDNFGLIDWTNYHKAGAVRPGNYVSYINGDDNSWEAVKTKDGSLPALLGIQLPHGYEKLTQKYNPMTGELMGEELITYGETEALNDTVPYGSSFYKRVSNYPVQKAVKGLSPVNTRP